MEMDSVLRRGFLSRLAATAGVVSTAGCLGSVGSTKYVFYTLPVGESIAELTDVFVRPDPTEIEAQFAVDYSAAYKRSVVETLFERGTVEVVGWQLAYDRSFGTTTRPKPQFLERDGTYYSVTEMDQTEITETRWVFYLDLVDETPDSSDTVITELPSSLSRTDQLIIRRALEPVWGHGGPVDVDDRPLSGRGPTYHQGMDPDTSALVPSAPFDYLKRGDAYFAPRAERGPVGLTRYTFAIEPVASSRVELKSYVKSTVVDATFDAASLDADAVEILRTATDIATGRLYTETGTMSEELTTITDRLGMTEHVPDKLPSYISLNGAVMSFDDSWYQASLSIRQQLL